MILNYELGFSLTGLILYALQLFPNIIWKIAPPVNDVLNKNSSTRPTLNNIEQVFGILTVVLLIFLINTGVGIYSNFYIGLAIIFLIGYYIAWILYYKGLVNPWLLIIGIAAMPPLYFLFIGFWLNNFVMIIPCIIFGVTHITITYSNYLK